MPGAPTNPRHDTGDSLSGTTSGVALERLLAQWRDSLLDLSRRNKLLYFKHPKAAGGRSLEIKSPGADVLLRGLGSGWTFASIDADDAEPEADGAESEASESRPRLRKGSGANSGTSRRGAKAPRPELQVGNKATQASLDRSLAAMHRHAVQMSNDYGLWVLQLGVGALAWREGGETDLNFAPLLLIPVQLTQLGRDEFRLVPADGHEITLNPALSVKLDRLGVNWRPVEAAFVDSAADSTADKADFAALPEVLATLVARARTAVAGQDGWSVSDRVVMAPFASHKEAMYRDLIDNEATILASPLVQALHTDAYRDDSLRELDFDPPDADHIDVDMPPEDTPLVLNADASQRQSIAAALRGHTFVMDGPPGTGKSQTIANMVAALLHQGRSVLFVSEKAAALDVVFNRLKAVQLDRYVLPLYGAHTSRKTVALALGDTLQNPAPVRRLLPEEERAQALALRIELSGHSAALNEVREPLQRTLHDVIGRLTELDAAVLVPPRDRSAGRARPGFAADLLSAATLTELLDAAGRIGRVWRPVEQGPKFVWRVLRDDAQRPETALGNAIATLTDLRQQVGTHESLARLLGLSSFTEIQELTRLLELTGSRPPLPAHWLTCQDFAADVEGPVRDLNRRLAELSEARGTAADLAGRSWDLAPHDLTSEVPDDEVSLREMTPVGVDVAALTARQAQALAARFSTMADELDHHRNALASVAELYGVPAPEHITTMLDLSELAELAAAPHRPEPQWLRPEGPEQVRNAVEDVRSTLADLQEARTRTLTALSLTDGAQAVQANIAALDLADHAAPSADEAALAQLSPPGVDPQKLTGEEIRNLRAEFASQADLIEKHRQALEGIAVLYGVPAPSDISDALDLAALTELSRAARRPEPEWLVPEVRRRAESAVEALDSAAATAAAARAAAADVFTEGVVDIEELPHIAERLAAAGVLNRMSARYRADRRILAAVLHSGVWDKGVVSRLSDAIAWQNAQAGWLSAIATHAQELRRYWVPDDPHASLAAAREALAIARRADELAASRAGATAVRDKLAAQLSADADPNERAIAAAAEADTYFRAWQRSLVPAPEAGPRLSLADHPFTHIVGWLRTHDTPLRESAALISRVATLPGTPSELPAPSGAVTGAHARQALQARLDPAQAWQAAEARFAAVCHEHRILVGSRLTGEQTDFDALADAVATAAEIMELAPLGDPHRLAGQFSSAAAPDLAAVGLARKSGDWLRTWRASLVDVGLGDALIGLASLPISEAAAWLRAHTTPLGNAARLAAAMDEVRESAGLNGACTTHGARAALEAIHRAHELFDRLRTSEADDRRLVGPLYDGRLTDPDLLREALRWAKEARRSHRGLPVVYSDEAAHALLHERPDPALQDTLTAWNEDLQHLLNLCTVAGADELRPILDAHPQSAEQTLRELAADGSGPQEWLEYRSALAVLRSHGLDDLPERAAAAGVTGDGFAAATEKSLLNAWVNEQFARDDRLGRHRGADRDDLVRQFQALDKRLIRAAANTVARSCEQRRPRTADVGEPGILLREANKKTRHMPVRTLLDRTRNVVQLIKPCFMMSPLAVSQLLPDQLRFDVVIFDEASQVLPGDAINCLYRASSMIVAGDAKQLPPTSFFTRGGDEGDDEWSEDGLDTFASFLDLCKASSVIRSLGLRWHYRSRHESLIDFSNRSFYSNSLISYPGALAQSNDVGVAFYRADGVYDRGGRRDNRVEAELVARRVLHHAQTRPGRSLGVVALSQAQADAIWAALSEARQQRPDLEKFFASEDDRLDGFFIKSLEAVQGDERDVMILSVGYGPDARGTLGVNFGPINKEGGWRRLNVAATRARYRTEVIASFSGDQLEDGPNASVQHLKRYLQYAERGFEVLAVDAADRNAETESPFEDSVLAVLRGWGYDVQPQVGVAGYRIDLGLRNPAAPGAYVLGIECDGATYHSSKTARDRDRLREEVLRGLGWRLHRIWSTDWFRHRADAEQRLRAAIDEALEASITDTRSTASAAYEPVEEASEDSDDILDTPAPDDEDTDQDVPWATVYEEAPHRRFAESSWYAMHEDYARPALRKLMAHIVAVEAPIHQELLFQRTREMWGGGKVGSRIRQNLDVVLRSLNADEQVRVLGEFVYLPGQAVVPRRPDSEPRSVERIAPEERLAVLRNLAADHPGITEDELFNEAMLFFGWTRRGPLIKRALTGDLHTILNDGTVIRGTNGFTAPPSTA